MTMTPARWAYLAIGILVAGGILSFCSRRDGIAIGGQNQRIKAAAADVQTIKLEKVVVDKAADVEEKKSTAVRTERRAARGKVEIRGDTVVADNQVVLMPSVSSLVRVDDRQSTQDSTTLQAKARSDSLGRVLVAGLDKHVDLLEEAKRPRCSTKCGIAIGTVGTVAVVTLAVVVIHAIAK